MSEEMYHVSRILSAFLTYVLVLLRTGSLVLFGPFLSSEVFMQRIRIYLALVVPFIFLPVATRTAALPETMEMVTLFEVAGQEFTIGIALALLARIVMAGVYAAGEISAQQIGLAMSSVMDPQSGMDMPILGFFNQNLTIMLFITAKLHLVLIYIVGMSYNYVGLGTLVMDKHYNVQTLEFGTAQVQEMLVLGVQLAAPLMTIMLLNNIVEGFITKTMPQMNIQVLGMPLNLIVGISALIFLYPAICNVLVPSDWLFNLRDMPEGPLGGMLQDLSEVVVWMGRGE